ncbi:hypothetical protein SELMODRAFT_405838 [Selaginella moellendorffii]|uniref:Uncharacterized protein n=1 Tax=Selaginella moellendorffii TaxID=88036 RepID=D8QZV0_SELML|nr:hypothetical protein SELMODRAFT_405838 [Selaginella moellendorffii]
MKNRRLAVLQPGSSAEGGARILANWRQRASPFHRDEVGDYEKSLAFASRLQGGDVPELIQEKVVSFVERYNQQYTKETAATSKPKDAMLRHELKYLRSRNELELLSLLPNARDEEEPSDRARGTTGDELVAKLDKKLDENTQAAAIGLEEIPRPWTEDTKLLVLTPEGIGLEVLEVTSLGLQARTATRGLTSS